MIQRNALSLSHPLKMFSHTELMAKTTLTLFTLMTHLYTSWNRQKTFGFLTLSGGIEMRHWREKG